MRRGPRPYDVNSASAFAGVSLRKMLGAIFYPHKTLASLTAISAIGVAIGYPCYAGIRNLYRQLSAGRQNRSGEPTTPRAIGPRDILLTAARSQSCSVVDMRAGVTQVTTELVLPILRSDPLLFPIVIRDWGRDWEAGPIISAMNSIVANLSPGQRKRLALSKFCASDIANTMELALTLDRAIWRIAHDLNRRPVIIADRLDRYQREHHRHFLAKNGAWVTAAEIANKNLFWDLVGTRASCGDLHLLIVTSTDMLGAANSVYQPK